MKRSVGQVLFGNGYCEQEIFFTAMNYRIQLQEQYDQLLFLACVMFDIFS